MNMYMGMHAYTVNIPYVTIGIAVVMHRLHRDKDT